MNGGSAQKILEQMRNSPSGWGQKDFERLLTGFGFKYREGKERVYINRRFPQLRISVPRHSSLREWVARDAVKLIDELLDLTNKESTQDENA
jgi:hypothetical protein